MLFAAVALTGVLASVGMQTLTGPVTSITRVTQKNIADNNLLMNAKIIVNAAVTGVSGGDVDTDGIIEPAPFAPAGGGETPPVNGGYLPTNLGLALTDPWGSKFGYCVWDHGATNSSANRITGDNTASAATQPVIAVIAAGADKIFQTTCSAYAGGAVTAAKAGGSDDLIFKYTYAEATASSNGLWTLNTSNQAKAELKDSSGTANVSINRSTGVGDFLGIITSTIDSKLSELINIGGALKLDTAGATVDTCDVAAKGALRLNATETTLELCDGAGGWGPANTPPAGSAGQVQFNNGSGGFGADANLYWDNTNKRLGIGTSAPQWPLVISSSSPGITLNGIGNTGVVGANFRAYSSRGTAASPANLQAGEDLGALAFSGFWTGKVDNEFVNGDARANVSAAATEDWTSAGNNGTALKFFTTPNGSAAQTERMRIDHTGNVGIGTISPTSTLTIVDHTSFSTELGYYGGIRSRYAGDPADVYRYWLTENTQDFGMSIGNASGLMLRGGDTTNRNVIAAVGPDLALYTGGTTNANAIERLRITAAGNVGIGTATPSSLLTVDGGGVADKGITISAVSGPYLELYRPAQSHWRFKHLGNSLGIQNSWIGGNYNNAIVLEDGLGISTAETMRLAYSGGAYRVGIGTSTPQSKLDVAGGVKVGADAVCNASKAGLIAWNTSQLQICDGTSFQNVRSVAKLDDVGDVYLTETGNPEPNNNEILAWNATDNRWEAKNINVVGSAVAAPGGTDKQVQFNDGGALAGASQMYWDKTNNRLGIGTAVPTNELHVVSAVAGAKAAQFEVTGTHDPTTTGMAGILLTNRDNTTSSLWGLTFAAYDTTDVGRHASAIAAGKESDWVGGSGNYAGYLGFWTRPAGGEDVERLRITSTGNVGIGTSTPQSKLDVAGGARVGADAVCSAAKAGMLAWNMNTLQVCTDAGTFTNIASASGASSQWSNGAPGAIYYNGGNVGIGTASPLSKLHVSQGSLFADAVQTDTVFDGVVDGDTGLNLIGSDGYWAIRTATNNSFNLDVFNSSSPFAALTVLQSGNVGIGTASPNSTLDIGGTSNTAHVQNLAAWGLNARSQGVIIMPEGTVSDDGAGNLTFGSNVIIMNPLAGSWIRVAAGTYALGGWGALWAPIPPTGARGTVVTPTVLAWADADRNYDGRDRVLLAQRNGAGYVWTRFGVPANLSAATGATSQWSNGGAGAIYYNGGNVGIGTATPYDKLHVHGSRALIQNGSFNDTTGNKAWLHLATDDWIASNYTSSPAISLYVDTLGTAGLAFHTYTGSAQAQRMTITASGNVGIGTASPGAKLGVDGDISLQLPTNNVDKGIYWGATGAVGYGRIYRNATSSALWIDAQANAPILLNAGTTGNVGIGTTSPSYKLDANGNIRATTSVTAFAGGAQGYVGMVAGTATNPGYVQWYRPDATTRIAYIGWGTSGANNLNLTLENGANFAVNGGNVGIGISTPGAMLDVANGSLQCCATQTPNISLAQQSSVNGYMSWLQFHNSGEAEGYIRLAGGAASGIRSGQRRFEIGDSQSVGTSLTVTGNIGIGTTSPGYKLHVAGTAYADGAAGALSDIRHKKNVATLKDGALGIVEQLRPVTFEWKEPHDPGMEGSQLGFIAQEVEKVLPQVVLTRNDKDETKGLKPTELIPVLTKAVQELKAANDNERAVAELESWKQRQEIDALRAANDNQARDIEELRRELRALRAASK